MSDVTSLSDVSDLQANTRSFRVKTASKLYRSSSRRLTALQVPNMDELCHLFRYKYRHQADPRREVSSLELAKLQDRRKIFFKDDHDDISRNPSYTKFKIPYNMICQKRYHNAINTYEAQLRHEIDHNISFQSTAADALFFMRCVAYSTFWPPLHHMREVNYTSQNFFRLQGREKDRFDYIMKTNII